MGVFKAYQHSDGQVIPQFTQVAHKYAESGYNVGVEVSEEEALGVALAHHFAWDGLALLRCFHAALEDANFHTENETVAQWIEQLSGVTP